MNKNSIILLIIIICAGGVYYFSQNLNQLISSQEAEKILNHQVSEAIQSVKEDLGSDHIAIHWEKFSCSKDLVCVSPKMTFAQNDENIFHLNDITFTLKKVTLEKGVGSFSMNFGIDPNFINEINQNNSNFYKAFKPLIPTSLACEGSMGIDGKQSLAANDHSCNLTTPSADYAFTLNTDVIHPVYKDENFLSVIRDQTGKFKDDKIFMQDLDQLLIGLRQFSFHIQSKDISNALYYLALISSPEISKEDFYSEVEQNLNMVSFITEMTIRSDETLSEENQNYFSKQLKNLIDGIAGIIMGDKTELSIHMIPKDTKNIKRFSATDLEAGSHNLNYFNVNITAK